jgi:hypothetical protein
MQTQLDRTARRRAGRRIAALALTACVALPAAAGATQIGDTKYDAPGMPGWRSGDMPADIVQPAVVQGDTKYDSPGASRAPKYDAPPIQVVRPATTVVRHVDEPLPIALAGTAVLLALLGVGIALRGSGAPPRLRRTD